MMPPAKRIAAAIFAAWTGNVWEDLTFAISLRKDWADTQDGRNVVPVPLRTTRIEIAGCS